MTEVSQCYKLKGDCICGCCRNVLIEVVKYLALRHKDASLSKDPNVALANILLKNKNIVENKIKCLTVPRKEGKITKTYVDIQLLDITSLCALILCRELQLLSTEKCCEDCQHSCLCAGTVCKNPTTCEQQACTGCGQGAESCRYVVFTICAIVTRDTRNIFSHEEDYRSLKEGKATFKRFPKAKTWELLWEQVNNGVQPCMKLLYHIDENLKDIYKDYKMDMRIALRKKASTLVDLCSEYFLTTGSVSSIDIVRYQDQNINFHDPHHQHKIVTSRSIAIENCVFDCDLERHYDVISVQTLNEGRWVIHDNWKIVDRCVEIYGLSVNIHYSVRILVDITEKEDSAEHKFAISHYDDFKITVNKEDIFIHDGKEVYYNDQRHKKGSAILQDVTSSTCILSCKETSEFLHAQIKWEGETTWKNANYVVKANSVEVKHLKQNVCTQIRVLCLEVTDDLETKYVIVEYPDLKISDEPESERFEIEGHVTFISSEKHKNILESDIVKIKNGLEVRLPNNIPKQMELLLIKKNRQHKRWQMMTDNDYRKLPNGNIEIENLEEEEHCFKIVMKAKDDGNGEKDDEELNELIHVFSIENFSVVGGESLKHVTNNSRKNTILMCHPNGKQTDVHQNIRNDYTTSCHQRLNLANHMYYQGGEISHELPEANYLQTNFADAIKRGDVIKFPPGSSSKVNLSSNAESESYSDPESHLDDEIIFRNQLCNRIEICYNESSHSAGDEPIVIVTQYSAKKHFQLTEIKPSDYEINLPSSDANRVIVFDKRLNAIINVRLAVQCAKGVNDHSNDAAPPMDYGKIKESFAECHEDLKALFLLHCDIIKNGEFALIGIVATNGLKREDVEKNHFCKDSSCSAMVLAMDDLSSDESFHSYWEEKLCSKIDEIKQNINIADEEKRQETLKLCEKFIEVPNRMLTVMSLGYGHLPSVIGHEDQKIKTILWNKEQLYAIIHRWKKKILQGPYGSGKSLVLEKLLKDFLRDPKNDGNVYVITWDGYSLLLPALEDYCRKLQAELQKNNSNTSKNNIDIICTSIVELSQGKETLISFSQLLRGLEELHPGEKVHVFVDEIDPEKLRREDFNIINKLTTTSKTFKDSTMILVLQSLDKERAVSTDYIQPVDLGLRLDSLKGFHRHTLPLTMRCTTKVHDVIKNAQISLSKEKVNVYRRPRKVNLRRLNSVSSGSMISDEDAKHETAQPRTSECAPTGESGYPKVTQSVDKLARLTDTQNENESGMTDKEVLRTTFLFQEADECGTKIPGNKPKLVRLKEYSRHNLGCVINKYIDKWNKRALFVCNNAKFAEILMAVLDDLKIKYVNYLHSTDMERKYPSAQRKRDVFNKWKNDNQCVLITDNRGICGLQYKKVFVFFDENEYHERCSWPEAVSRTTTQLYLISYEDHHSNSNQPQKTTKTIKHVVEQLIKRKAVDELDPRNVGMNVRVQLTNTEIRKKHRFTPQEASELLDKEFKIPKKNTTLDSTAPLEFPDLAKLLIVGETGTFNSLITNDPSRAKSVNNFGNDLLHVAAMYNRPGVIETLINCGCENSTNEDGGWTAHHWAAFKGNLEALKELILYDKSKINAKTAAGLTPSDIAERENHIHVVDLLFENLEL